MIPAILVGCGIAYNLLAIAGALRFRRRKTIPPFRPPVSILKPVRGRDPHFFEAIRSHATQNYPEFELLFGVADPDDPAIPDILRLQRDFPALPIRIAATANDAPNRKAGSLAILAREARYGVLLVNDGDILVEPDYLARVISLLEDEQIGLVTCLYRGRGLSRPAKAEALGIATEFAPSVLVARLLSSTGFALGSTMAFRKRELEAIGGFEAIREYLADDYQLGARISSLDKRVAMADTIVETNLGAGSWRDVWKHQVRWSRTIRISRPGGYFGYLVTQATFWCLVAAVSGYGKVAVAGMAVRLAAAACAMRALGTGGYASLVAVPLRDLFGFAVWGAGIFGNAVEWRGVRYRLLPDGRMQALK
ncbi:MAG TPA: bacteriohopanetetrol glucosamine biosynthesis glycosyltransferase HpnI [Bryobacteraceae bacterium]|nr:bacteriohopanetetrol glucosamine biosynthesis glycosyltransferase HpnI [Bryobacteraceae bacterium]